MTRFTSPSAPVGGASFAPLAAQQALHQMMQDTLTCVGTMDVTDHHGLLSSLNLLDRLLGVIGQPAPRLEELGEALRSAGATARPALAASLYRELAALARRHLGATLLLDEDPD